jgi:hypothetical protein
MREADASAPRALLNRLLVPVELTPSELHRLVRALETEAVAAIDDGKDDYADYLLRRVELREAAQ